MGPLPVASGQDSFESGPGLIRNFGDAHFHTDGDVFALAFADDGTLRSLEERGDLRIWSQSGQVLRHFRLSEFEAWWVFSANGLIVGSGSNDLAFWEADNGRLLCTREQPSWITALAFSSKGDFAVTGHDDGIVSIWSVADCQLVAELPAHSCPVSAVAFDPPGKRLASAGEDKAIVLWDLSQRRQLGRLTGHTDRINSLLWLREGRLLISAGWDSSARVWDPANLQPLILLNAHGEQVTALACSPDGKTLAAADSDFVIHLWDLDTFSQKSRLYGHTGGISALAFSHNGERLASGGEGHFVRLWDVGRGEALGTLTAPAMDELPPCGLALGPDGVDVATCIGRTIRVWNVRDGSVAWQSTQSSSVLCLTCSRDGCWLAGGCADGVIRVWDRSSKVLCRELRDELFTDPVTSLDFSPDSNSLAAASRVGMSVWIWNLAAGEPELLIPDPLQGCAVETLRYHPENRLLAVGGIDRLATGGSDGAIALWDIDLRCELATFSEGTSCLSYHPSGLFLASTTLAKSICIWDLEKRELALELAGDQAPFSWVAYSPDGRLLAGGGHERNLRLWDAVTGAIRALVVLQTEPRQLAFSGDSRHLFTANANGTLSQFDVEALLETGNR
jgi:WD40 repeat protein